MDEKTRIAALSRAQINAFALALIQVNEESRTFATEYLDRLRPSKDWSPQSMTVLTEAGRHSRVWLTLRWCPPPSLDLAAMCREELPCDVTISCGRRDFHAHRVLLERGSEFFQGMFAAGMSDSEGAITIQPELADEVTLELALTFLYHSSCTLRHEGLIDLLEVAVRLQMPALIDQAINEVVLRLGPENCIGALGLGAQLGLPTLQRSATKYIREVLAVKVDTIGADHIGISRSSDASVCTGCQYHAYSSSSGSSDSPMVAYSPLSYELVEGYPQTLVASDGDELHLFKYRRDRGVSYAQAKAFLDQHRAGCTAMPAPWGGTGFYRSLRTILGRSEEGAHSYALLFQVPGAGAYHIIRPPSGMGKPIESLHEFANGRYERIDDEAARVGWESSWLEALDICAHGPNCRSGPRCTIGKRVEEKVAFAGAALPKYWHVLKRHAQIIPVTLGKRKRDDLPMLVLLQFNGRHCLGVDVSDVQALDDTLKSLQAASPSRAWEQDNLPTVDFGGW